MSKVALVTGNDTGVGKTNVAASLAKALFSMRPTRYVKVVETGVADSKQSDVTRIKDLADEWIESMVALRSFEKALAPVAAATMEGHALSLTELISETRQSSKGEGWTIVEGAGGVAVPLDSSGDDWRDFAVNLPVDLVILVLENRLGAINQMRLLEAYCSALTMPCGFWLNEVRTQESEIVNVNKGALLESTLPIWATQRFGKEPVFTDISWLNKIQNE
ncbi:MAG: dethiobiotin synthase [Opitutales bacterium]